MRQRSREFSKLRQIPPEQDSGLKLELRLPWVIALTLQHILGQPDDALHLRRRIAQTGVYRDGGRQCSIHMRCFGSAFPGFDHAVPFSPSPTCVIRGVRNPRHPTVPSSLTCTNRRSARGLQVTKGFSVRRVDCWNRGAGRAEQRVAYTKRRKSPHPEGRFTSIQRHEVYSLRIPGKSSLRRVTRCRISESFDLQLDRKSRCSVYKLTGSVSPTASTEMDIFDRH